MKKRIFAALIALVMLVSLLPTSAFADDSTYAIGDKLTVAAASALPAAPEGTQWVLTDTTWSCGLAEHTHSFANNCYTQYTGDKYSEYTGVLYVKIGNEYFLRSSLTAEQLAAYTGDVYRLANGNNYRALTAVGDKFYRQQNDGPVGIVSGAAVALSKGSDISADSNQNKYYYLSCTQPEHTHGASCTAAYTDELKAVTYTATVTVRNGSSTVRNQTITLTGGITATTNNSGVATFNVAAGSYTASVHYLNDSRTYDGSAALTVTAEGGSATINVTDKGYTLENAQDTYNETTYFNHVDVRSAGTIKIGTYVNGVLQGSLVTKNVIITNPSIKVTDGNTVIANRSFTGSTSYEWRITNIRVPKTAVITMTCDIQIEGETAVKTGQTFTYSGEATFVQAIFDCDGKRGLDFNISAEDITNT